MTAAPEVRPVLVTGPLVGVIKDKQARRAKKEKIALKVKGLLDDKRK